MNNSSQQITSFFASRQTHGFGAFLLCVRLMLALVIIITNSLVLVVVWRVPEIFRSIDVLLVNLAVVDNLTGLSIIFQMCLDSLPQLLKNRVLCLIYFQMPTFFMLTSGYIILLVALERYMIMSHTVTHQRLRKSKVFIALSIASAYIVPGLLTIYPYLKQNKILGMVCDAFLIFDQGYIISLSVNIWVVVPLCSVIYVKIIRVTRRQMNLVLPFIQESAGASHRSTNPNELPVMVFNIMPSSGQTNPPFTKLKQIRLRLAVTIGFAVCWLPVSFIPIITLYHPGFLFEHVYLGPSFMAFGMANSFLNPIIYMISRRTFRQAMRMLFRCSN